MNNTGFVPTTKAELQTAVDAWVANSTTATTTYGDINDWNVSSITDMSNLFQAKTTFNSDISNWDVSAVTDMRSMFEGATAFNQDISGWERTSPASTLGAVKNMNYMFNNCSAFNQDISGWDVSEVTDMSSMFEGATAFNQDISGWDISSVINMNKMFYNAYKFNQDISDWDVSSVTDHTDIFKEGSMTFLNSEDSVGSNPDDSMNYMYWAGCTNFNEMFKNHRNFNIDISNWSTAFGSKIITFTDIFYGATALNNIRAEAGINTSVAITKSNWSTNVICFYGFVNIMTDCGLKQIKDLKRGDMILTNDGYQPLAELDVGFNPSDDLLMSKLKSTDFMVKIPKDFFAETVPSEDVYVTKTHPLSVKITSADDDKDFEFLHLFVKELMQLGDGIEYVRKDSETKLYNLIFDNHYEINVGNMKFLSHHPNHLNKNKYLVEGTEQNQQNRTKKIYAIEGQCFFDIITLKDLLKQKPENMTDKEYLASVLTF